MPAHPVVGVHPARRSEAPRPLEQAAVYPLYYHAIGSECRLQTEYIAHRGALRHYVCGGNKMMRQKHSFGLNLKRRIRWAIRMATVRRLKHS